MTSFTQTETFSTSFLSPHLPLFFLHHLGISLDIITKIIFRSTPFFCIFLQIYKLSFAFPSAYDNGRHKHVCGLLPCMSSHVFMSWRAQTSVTCGLIVGHRAEKLCGCSKTFLRLCSDDSGGRGRGRYVSRLFILMNAIFPQHLEGISSALSQTSTWIWWAKVKVIVASVNSWVHRKINIEKVNSQLQSWKYWLVSR